MRQSATTLGKLLWGFSLAPLSVLISVLVFASPVPLSAQFNPLAPGALTTFEANVSPELPGPQEQTVIDLLSSSLDLNRAHISWSEDGKIQTEGVGLTRFSFTTKGLGSATSIVIRVSSAGVETTKELTIRPGSVDLIWESDGYTPAFYRGKSPTTPGSNLTFVAMPHLRSSSTGADIASTNVVFRWSKNGTVLGSLSGTGKNVLRLTAPVTGSMTVRVEVSSQDENLKAASEIQVGVENPRILFYEDDPVLGVRFERAVSNSLILSKHEERLVAIPFGFSARTRGSEDLLYQWKVGNVPLETKAGEKDAIVISGGANSGTAAISLTIDHAVQFMQNAVRALTATAEGGSEANPFSL